MYNNNVDYEILTGNITATGLNSILNIEYCDIAGGEDGIWPGNNPATINWLDGNIDEEPLFTGIGDYPFSLQDISPCVNAGIPDTTGFNLPELDLAGNPRVYGGRIDMGAYENQNVVGANEDLIPLVTKLNQNYPNPFNPTTTIKFNLIESGEVKLIIYNIKGQKVKILMDCYTSPGDFELIWDGKDDNNKPVGSGVYFYQLNINGNSEAINKMILMK